MLRTNPTISRAVRALCRLLLAGSLVASVGADAFAQSSNRVALPKEHPLVGTWRIEIPATRCHETYEIGTEGSMRVTSAAQTAEADLTLSLKAAASGFYKWTEQVTTQNGQPDCQGQRIAVGHLSTNFIILDAPAREFLMCAAEDINTCVGPFVRQTGS